MNKLLAALLVVLVVLNGALLYVVAGHLVDTGGKGGTTNVDSAVLNGSITIAADNNGNGVTDTGGRKALTTSTTTPCAIQSPAATSTIVSTSANITTGANFSSIVTIATSTTPYATSSLMATIAVGSGAQATPNWDGGVNNALISPNTYIVYGVAGGVFNGAGTCNAVFRSVN